MIDRKRFYDVVRTKVFNATLTQAQVDGMNLILDHWEKTFPATAPCPTCGIAKPAGDPRKLAYMLATAAWETNKTMQAVREAYWLSEEWRKANLRYYPYYGRGLVQLTWKTNYEKMGNFLCLDLVGTPDLALNPHAAVLILFEGMFNAQTGVGDFTGKSLEEFFTDTREDPVGARTIINGTDKAREIAALYYAFKEALTS